MTNICRTCLINSDNLIPIYGKPNLAQEIEVISSIKVIESDEILPMICKECAKNVKEFYTFRKKIIDSDVIWTVKPEESQVSSQDLQTDIDNEKKCDKTKKTNVKKTEKKEKKNDSDFSDDEEYIPKITTNPRNDLRKFPDSYRIDSLGNTVYTCKECDFETAEYKRLSIHSLKHRPKSECTVCKKLITTYNLQHHMKMHTGSVVICKVCKKHYKNQESLRRHMIAHDTNDTTCEVCGRTFDNKMQYQRHYSRNHKERKRKYQCDKCEKSYFYSHGLKKHYQIHTGIRPHQCPQCCKGFSSTHALKTHIRQHTHERPYTCKYCSMGFIQKVLMKSHMKSKHNDNGESD